MGMHILSQQRAGDGNDLAAAIDKHMLNFWKVRVVFTKTAGQFRRKRVTVVFAREHCICSHAQYVCAKESTEPAMSCSVRIVGRHFTKTMSVHEQFGEARIGWHQNAGSGK